MKLLYANTLLSRIFASDPEEWSPEKLSLLLELLVILHQKYKQELTLGEASTATKDSETDLYFNVGYNGVLIGEKNLKGSVDNGKTMEAIIGNGDLDYDTLLGFSENSIVLIIDYIVFSDNITITQIQHSRSFVESEGPSDMVWSLAFVLFGFLVASGWFLAKQFEVVLLSSVYDFIILLWALSLLLVITWLISKKILNMLIKHTRYGIKTLYNATVWESNE